MGTPDPLTGHEARLAADRRRAAMLLRLRRQSETDGRQCLPMLIDACCKDSAMLSLHVWAVDQAIFGTGRIRAGRHIETAAAWCGHHIGSPWTVDMGWLLDERTGGSRLAAWTYAIALDNGFRPSGPDPYHS